MRLKQTVRDRETELTKLWWEFEDTLVDKKKLLEGDVDNWDIQSSLEQKIKKLE